MKNRLFLNRDIHFSLLAIMKMDLIIDGDELNIHLVFFLSLQKQNNHLFEPK